MVESLLKPERVLPAMLEKGKRDLEQDDSIMILPADKGKKTVVMDRFDYKVSVMRTLSDQEA